MGPTEVSVDLVASTALVSCFGVGVSQLIEANLKGVSDSKPPNLLGFSVPAEPCEGDRKLLRGETVSRFSNLDALISSDNPLEMDWLPEGKNGEMLSDGLGIRVEVDDLLGDPALSCVASVKEELGDTLNSGVKSNTGLSE